MRPISFRKGTLCLGVPNAVASGASIVEFRAHRDEWALRVALRGGGEYLAVGWYHQAGPDIDRGGAAVTALPSWWGEGRPERPEPWETAALFGASAAIDLGEVAHA